MSMNRAAIFVASALLTLCLCGLASGVEARPLTPADVELLRKAAELGVQSPRPLDMRRFEGVDIAPLHRVPDLDERAMLLLLRQSSQGLARAVDAADPAVRRATLEVLAGSRAIEQAIPTNPLRRAEIVESGGIELLRAAAQPVEGLGEALLLLDGSVRAGRLPDGALEGFGRALNAQGEVFVQVWGAHIMPNWEVVLAGGLVTAFLLEPERFIDATGRLTTHAVSAFADLGITVGTSIVEGIGRGVWSSVRRQIDEGAAWTLIAPVAALVALIISWRRYARRERSRGASGTKP